MFLAIVALFALEPLLAGANGYRNLTINILHVNEDVNEIADHALESALTYLKQNPQIGIQINIERVVGTRSDAKGLLESLCKTYGKSVEDGQPPHAVFDTTITGIGSETVKTFTAGLRLPTISASFGQLRLWKNSSQEAKKYLIQVMPPADVIPHVIRAIIWKQQLVNAAILHDNTFIIGKWKTGFVTRHVTSLINQDGKIRDQLTGLQRLNITNVFVLGSLPSIKSVLETAENLDFFSRKFAWFAISQDQSDLEFNCRDCTVLHIRPKLESQYRKRLNHIRETYELTEKPEIVSTFYFDLALTTFVTIKNMILNETWPSNFTYRTCADYDGVNKPPRYGLDLRSAIQKPSSLIPTYGPLNITINGESHMEFDMEISAINLQSGSATSSKILGTWKAGLANNLKLVEDQALNPYRADVVYKVVTIIHEPFVYDDPNAPKNFSGFCIDLFDEIARVLKFDYEIYKAPDGKFGQLGPQGEWNGAIKEMLEKRADLALGTISIMAERETAIDFTVPFYDLVGIAILMKKPKSPSALFKFLTVLEDEVWLCILAAYLCTSVLMAVFDRYSPYSYQNNREKYKDDEEKREFTFRECLWFCMTSLTPQGGGEAPKNLSGRLVAATWWLFGFIIIASYTANLAAFLTVSRLETTIESLEDLYKQYKIQYAPVNGSIEAQYFERMDNIEATFYEIWKEMSLNDSLSEVERSKLAVWDYPVSDKYTKIWKSMKDAGFPLSFDEAVNRVLSSETGNDEFAMIGDSNDLKYLALTNCELEVVGDDFSKKPVAIAVQDGSPLKASFDTVILSFLNNRFQEKLKEKWWTNNPYAQRCKGNGASSGITLDNIGGVFIVIFIGIGFSCVILMFEYWWYKCRKGSKVRVSVKPVSTPHQNYQANLNWTRVNNGIVLRPRLVQPKGSHTQNRNR